MRSLIAAHRPELADFLFSAEIDLDFPGVWVRPGAAFDAVSPAWLEPRLLAAAIEGGLPLEWIRVLAVKSSRGREAWCRGNGSRPGWCPSCGSAALVAGGYCRACYDRRRRSAQHFAGYREAVLIRDGCCQTCIADLRLVERALVVHHRRPGVNRPAVHITLCWRCHVRVHRRNQRPGLYSDLFFRLWREVHPGAPAPLRLPLAA